jgi:hypothetical protein
MKALLFWFYFLRSHPMAYWQPQPKPPSLGDRLQRIWDNTCHAEPMAFLPESITFWDCGGYRYWRATNPINGHFRWFTSERDARLWLEHGNQWDEAVMD